MPTARLPRLARRLGAAVILPCLLLGTGAMAQTVTPSDAPPAVQADLPTPGMTAPATAAATMPDLPAAAATPPIAARTAAPTPALLHDLSPWGMFMAAHVVVQGVMISLALASFLTWTVLVYKVIELAVARMQVRRSGRVIRDADTLAAASSALEQRRDPAAFMAQAALTEYRRSGAALAAAGPDGVKERTRSILERVEVQASSRIRKGTGLLATIGATAPFVGLFGTVWGIMNAFVSIAESQTTNLAVVAPGIAEALLATAIGLVAAIPAVVFYNHFARAIAGYRQLLGDAGTGVERLLSRDLDFGLIDPPKG